MVVGEKKLDKAKGDHKVTFTLTVALAFPSGMCHIKIYCMTLYIDNFVYQVTWVWPASLLSPVNLISQSKHSFVYMLGS